MHFNICELNDIITRWDHIYFITFIDNFSIYTYVYVTNSKDDAFNIFKYYKFVVENAKEKKIKIFRSDRGGDYLLTRFSMYCKENGIIHQTSVPSTPQQDILEEEKIAHYYYVKCYNFECTIVF